MLEYDVVIIGGGPAGIMAAIAAGRSSHVLLLEKNPSLGRKLLLTGGGRCNITNLKNTRELLNHYNNKNFLKHSFYTFTNEDLLSMFKVKGLDYIVEDNDRVFPESQRSSDVLNILIEYLEDVDVWCNYEVKSISDDFIINSEIKADKIIIATGGVTYPQTGTSPDNYSLTPQPVTSIKYGLAPLVTLDDVSSLSGVRVDNVGITYKNKIQENILFSHFGISGPGIINISNEISESLDYDLINGEVQFSDTLRVDFLFDVSYEKLVNTFNSDIQKSGKVKIKNYLKKYFPKKFITFFLAKLSIDSETRLSQISKKDKKLLCENLKNFPIEVSSFKGELSKVTIGGVDLNFVNPKTMESKIIPGLYFAGEVLDVHGPTGGYNLKIAFSTGYLAGLSSSLSIKH